MSVVSAVNTPRIKLGGLTSNDLMSVVSAVNTPRIKLGGLTYKRQ